MDCKRPLAVFYMVCLAAVAACDEDKIIEPPPPPPQIETTIHYTKTLDKNGQPNGLPSDDVYDFLVVSNGEVWIGTASGIAVYNGLNKTKSDDIYDHLNALPNPKVRRMVEYGGRVYVATWGGGVGVFDLASRTWGKLDKEDGLAHNEVADIAVAPNESGGRVYFATNLGVSTYDPTAGTFSNFKPLDYLVSCVEVVDTPRGIERWYGPRAEHRIPPDSLQYHGITVRRGSTTTFKLTIANSGLAEPNVNDILYDAQADVFWVAFASKGIAAVDVVNSTWTLYTTVQGLPSDQVYSITKVGSAIWVATQAGIARQRQDGQWQGYARSGGLPADRARRVYSDDGQRLWVGFIEGGAVRADAASAD